LKSLGVLHRDVRMLFAAADFCVVVTRAGTFVPVGGRHLTEEARVCSQCSPVGAVEGKVGLE